MSPATALVLAIACQRLCEIVIASRNTRRLLAGGAVEIGRGHYPLFVILHGSWLSACLVVADGPVATPPMAVLAFLLAGRVWVMISLGRYWTTRIITKAGTPLVHRGAYRLLRHPNYIIAAAEIALLPLALGAWQIAVFFSTLNGALLAHRIETEEAALADRVTVRGRIPGAG